MNVVVNGGATDLSEGATVASVVEHLAREPSGIAVALNGEVVPRGLWPDTTLDEGDRVEVLRAIGGGSG